mmetsp:Transcript_36942/g.40043  ORF Transcript_36942/g.40043 Transcript_36942/m.40043 type:complete len:274 (-) Transcript_36942:564-1385(-)
MIRTPSSTTIITRKKVPRRGMGMVSPLNSFSLPTIPPPCVSHDRPTVPVRHPVCPSNPVYPWHPVLRSNPVRYPVPHPRHNPVCPWHPVFRSNPRHNPVFPWHPVFLSNPPMFPRSVSCLRQHPVTDRRPHPRFRSCPVRHPVLLLRRVPVQVPVLHPRPHPQPHPVRARVQVLPRDLRRHRLQVPPHHHPPRVPRCHPVRNQVFRQNRVHRNRLGNRNPLADRLNHPLDLRRRRLRVRELLQQQNLPLWHPPILLLWLQQQFVHPPIHPHNW